MSPVIIVIHGGSAAMNPGADYSQHRDYIKPGGRHN